MCGLVGVVGEIDPKGAERALSTIVHRGPDAAGAYASACGTAWLGHRRLSIIDLSDAGRQPLTSADGRYHLVFNGEIYNYLELRRELAHYPFRTDTDSEVILAAFVEWGAACLDRLLGMFTFLIWDERERDLFGARDRFGVKPLYYAQSGRTVALASEIKALRAGGFDAGPDEGTWASYLSTGRYEVDGRTFWAGIRAVPAGHLVRWRDGRFEVKQWYDIADRIGTDYDDRPVDDVEHEYLDLLTDSVALRFRADVPVGINLSGGLDSSTLLAAVHAVQGTDSEVKAFTFVTGDPNYDELPWVSQMLARTHHPLIACPLAAHEVPQLAEKIQAVQDEPFGGLPTLAYARLFLRAREEGVIVLLDGQGMDEQWAGYDYYRRALTGEPVGVVQGTAESPVRPHCLTPDLLELAMPSRPREPFPDGLRNAQYRDITSTKLARALRFNDRVSMHASTELREPFLDHRLVELALRQPPERKIQGAVGKYLLRRMVGPRLPANVIEAPKRPLQTPQREWLRGPLAGWARERIEAALEAVGGTWLEPAPVRAELDAFLNGRGDNSFFVWQWITLGLSDL